VGIEYYNHEFDRIVKYRIQHPGIPDYLAIGSIIGSLTVYIMASQIKYKWYYFLVGTLALFGLTGRGPLIGVATCLIIFVLLSLLSTTRKKDLVGAMLIIFICAISLWQLADRQGYTVSRFSYKALQSRSSSVESRYRHYDKFIRYYPESPLLGHGIGSYPVITERVDSRQYPHNIFMEVAFEYGLVGALLVLLIVCTTILGLGRSIIHPRLLPYVMVNIFLLLQALKSNAFEDLRYVAAWMGLLVAQSSITHKGE